MYKLEGFTSPELDFLENQENGPRWALLPPGR